MVLSLMGAGLATQNYVEILAEQAQIEQLRRDSAKVKAEVSEDVVGQVIATNQRIVKMQKYNNIFFVGWFVPNGWSQVEPIAVPE